MALRILEIEDVDFQGKQPSAQGCDQQAEKGAPTRG